MFSFGGQFYGQITVHQPQPGQCLCLSLLNCQRDGVLGYFSNFGHFLERVHFGGILWALGDEGNEGEHFGVDNGRHASACYKRIIIIKITISEIVDYRHPLPHRKMAGSTCGLKVAGREFRKERVQAFFDVLERVGRIGG